MTFNGIQNKSVLKDVNFRKQCRVMLKRISGTGSDLLNSSERRLIVNRLNDEHFPKSSKKSNIIHRKIVSSRRNLNSSANMKRTVNSRNATVKKAKIDAGLLEKTNCREIPLRNTPKKESNNKKTDVAASKARKLRNRPAEKESPIENSSKSKKTKKQINHGIIESGQTKQGRSKAIDDNVSLNILSKSRGGSSEVNKSVSEKSTLPIKRGRPECAECLPKKTRSTQVVEAAIKKNMLKVGKSRSVNLSPVKFAVNLPHKSNTAFKIGGKVTSTPKATGRGRKKLDRSRSVDAQHKTPSRGRPRSVNLSPVKSSNLSITVKKEKKDGKRALIKDGEKISTSTSLTKSRGRPRSVSFSPGKSINTTNLQEKSNKVVKDGKEIGITTPTKSRGRPRSASFSPIKSVKTANLQMNSNKYRKKVNTSFTTKSRGRPRSVSFSPGKCMNTTNLQETSNKVVIDEEKIGTLRTKSRGRPRSISLSPRKSVNTPKLQDNKIVKGRKKIGTASPIKSRGRPRSSSFPRKSVNNSNLQGKSSKILKDRKNVGTTTLPNKSRGRPRSVSISPVKSKVNVGEKFTITKFKENIQKNSIKIGEKVNASIIVERGRVNGGNKSDRCKNVSPVKTRGRLRKENGEKKIAENLTKKMQRYHSAKNIKGVQKLAKNNDSETNEKSRKNIKNKAKSEAGKKVAIGKNNLKKISVNVSTEKNSLLTIRKKHASHNLKNKNGGYINKKQNNADQPTTEDVSRIEASLNLPISESFETIASIENASEAIFNDEIIESESSFINNNNNNDGNSQVRQSSRKRNTSLNKDFIYYDIKKTRKNNNVNKTKTTQINPTKMEKAKTLLITETEAIPRKNVNILSDEIRKNFESITLKTNEVIGNDNRNEVTEHELPNENVDSIKILKPILKKKSPNKYRRGKKIPNYAELSGLSQTISFAAAPVDNKPIYKKPVPEIADNKPDDIYEFDFKEEKKALKKMKNSDINEYDKGMDEVLQNIVKNVKKIKKKAVAKMVPVNTDKSMEILSKKLDGKLKKIACDIVNKPESSDKKPIEKNRVETDLDEENQFGDLLNIDLQNIDDDLFIPNMDDDLPHIDDDFHTDKNDDIETSFGFIESPIKILSNVQVKPPTVIQPNVNKTTTNLEETQFMQPLANSTILETKAMPFRFEGKIRRAPLCLVLKRSNGLPSCSQNMIIDHNFLSNLTISKDSSLNSTKLNETNKPEMPKHITVNGITESTDVIINDCEENFNSPHKTTKQTSILNFVNTSHTFNPPLQNENSTFFDEGDLSPIKTATSPLKRKILAELNVIIGSTPNVQKKDNSLFGFNTSKYEVEKRADKPTRFNINDVKKVAVDEKKYEPKVIVELMPNLNDESHIVEDNDVQIVGLFEDFEVKMAPARTSYANKRPKRNRINIMYDDIAKDDEQAVEMPKRKKKNARTKKEEEEAEKWAEAFNSMCKEVEEHNLEIE